MSLPKYYTDPFVSSEALATYGEELCDTAAHEAGHFVMNILIDGSLPRGLSIVPAADSDGRIRGAGWFGGWSIDWIQQPSVEQRAAIRRDVLMIMAASVADGGDWDEFSIEFEYAGDYDDARTYLAKLGESIEDVTGDYRRFAYALLKYKRVRRAIRFVVDTILARQELDCNNGLYDLCDQTEKILGDYHQRARRRIEEWTQARDKTQNAQAIAA